MIKDLPGVKPATGAGQSGHYGAYQIYTDTASARAFVKDADGEALIITSDSGKQGQLKVSVRLDNPEGKNYSNKNLSDLTVHGHIKLEAGFQFNHIKMSHIVEGFKELDVTAFRSRVAKSRSARS